MILTPEQVAKNILELLDKSVEHILEARKAEIKTEILDTFYAAMFQGPKEIRKRKPLIPEEVDFLVAKYTSFEPRWIGGEVFVTQECDAAALVRAVEQAHGIGEGND